MNSSFYYTDVNAQLSQEPEVQKDLSLLRSFSEDNYKQIYVIEQPVGETKYKYDYNKALIVLIPKVRILIINYGDDTEEFYNFEEDFIEDLGILSDKYDYKSYIGRPRHWRNSLIKTMNSNEYSNIIDAIEENYTAEAEFRKVDLIISLLTGSINDINRVGEISSTDPLQQIKKNIVLFDAEQTRFIFNKPEHKRITIQGLAGAGKTELLLHKIKNIYKNEDDTKIFFTCFNKVLAKDLRSRIPEFFDFMKVEEQIKWGERLWVERGWGSRNDKNSGLYAFICNHYDIPFRSYSRGVTFKTICKETLGHLQDLKSQGNFEPFFDYILIDESQDFNEYFFKLCEEVTKNEVYIAGDIFQNIFEDSNSLVENPDFLLNKVYRTDPKTLMFAHAIGFGLLERPVIRWLSDEEWEACGYIFEKKDNLYEFSREPLNRFTDLGEVVSNIEVSTSDREHYVERIMEAIKEIKANHSTVEPDDIGIIFLENNDYNYNLVEELIIRIDFEFGWSAIKGYEEKNKIKDSLYISNRNNVKGLEFPFVICVTTTPLKSNTIIRNSLYMMLTRSFLTSYLILSEKNGELNSAIKRTASEIKETGVLTVKEPMEGEIMDTSDLRLEASEKESQYDIVERLLNDEFEISSVKDREKVHKMVDTMLGDRVDIDKIRSLISDTVGYL
ncbi:DEAD/DEAH box helicase [Salinicoccus sesuvii]|uniref:DEAD/DEAH box helicase n=1 Tax=Salinicoccus sesuvii TaxID=868281 RepID=A0ABV7N3U4_9STAP